ncbi:MAG: propionyl-CoA synthetase, partial [Solirubrobacterales bacterium]|nr:propionyl-CoA synthetase [Solirubrobacterales bacterium]
MKRDGRTADGEAGSVYAEVYRRSLADPEGFWLEAAAAIDWAKEPSRALDRSGDPFFRWFPDGRLNTCFNALDRHVEAGFGERTALVWDSPVSEAQARYSFAELTEEVARCAGMLRGLGVSQGDRVIVYMPMVPQTLITMLACARIGAVHSVVFGGFAAAELAARIKDARPRALVCGSCGIEPGRVIEYKPIVDRAIDLSGHAPEAVVVFQREEARAQLGERDLDFREAVAAATPVEPVDVAATDPLYILYTSGTTGKPKGVVRDNGGHAVAMSWSMYNLYDVGAGDVWWSASDVGWVVGHSYIVYAPLLVGAATVMYEGKPIGTPDAGAFWRVISEHGVKSLFTAPTAFRAIKKADPEGRELDKYDMSRFESLYLAGERLDPETYSWATDVLGVPVIDHWWQTETGWAIAGNPRGIEALPIKPGSPTVPMPGWDVEVLDGEGKSLPAGSEGALCVKLPMPPGALLSLWQDDQRYIESYLSQFAGYYLSGDGGYFDEDGYLFVMGRTDDVINVAGHRLSTGSMEAVLAGHPAVAECAVIGVSDSLKGQIPCGFVVLKSGSDVDEEQLQRELVAAVREEIGAVAAFRDVRVVEALPKTRSGKILRKTMRGIAEGRDEPVPSTIEDPAVL